MSSNREFPLKASNRAGLSGLFYNNELSNGKLTSRFFPLQDRKMSSKNLETHMPFRIETAIYYQSSLFFCLGQET